MNRSRQARFYTTDGKVRVETQVERQPFQPIDQQETEEQQATRHSPKEWDAAFSLVILSRTAWVKDIPNCYTPNATGATLQLHRLQREDAELARNLTLEDVQAALALVKASQTEKQQATHHSPEEWDAALSLINLSRKAWVNYGQTYHHASDDVEAAARRLIQLQREDAELARNLNVEDVGAALALVKASRESFSRESVATLQGFTMVGMSTVMPSSMILSTGVKGWIIDGVH